MTPSPIDVLITTRNEAAHIQEAVANAAQVGPVYVLDSGSTDATCDLARAAGAAVHEHAWEGYARQKNWGLDHLPLQGEWVLILDADERLTPALRDELLRVVAAPSASAGYYVNRQLVFMGRAIRHGGLYPSWHLRFFRRNACRYEDRSVHEHMVCQGPTEYLRGEIVHVRLETVSQYVAKHIRYADLESDEWIKQRLGRSSSARPDQIFRDSLRWRQWLRRRLWPRLPLRPVLRFFYMYLLRLGFLDGIPGWHLAALMANYEYMIGMLYQQKLAALKAQKP